MLVEDEGISQYESHHLDKQTNSVAVKNKTDVNIGNMIQKVKVKVKFILEQAMKAERGVEAQFYSFFNLGARGVGGQRHAPAALPSAKTRYPLYRRLGGPQGRFGRVRQVSSHRDSENTKSGCKKNSWKYKSRRDNSNRTYSN